MPELAADHDEIEHPAVVSDDLAFEAFHLLPADDHPAGGILDRACHHPAPGDTVVEARPCAVAEPAAFLLELGQIRVGEDDAFPVDDLSGRITNSPST